MSATKSKTVKPDVVESKPVTLKSTIAFFATGTLLLLVFFTLVHLTSLRYTFKSDPLARVIEFTRITFAKSAVDKANTHLSLAEDKLKDFKRIKEKSPSSPHLGLIASDMVRNDKAAMKYMDEAKKGGADIKKLQLVTRLCDSLGEQSKELKSVNTEIVGLHDFAAALEDKVEAGVGLEQAMKEVEESLNQAMEW